MTQGRAVPPLPEPEPEIAIRIDPHRLKLRHIVALEEAMVIGVKAMLDWLADHAAQFLDADAVAAHAQLVRDLPLGAPAPPLARPELDAYREALLDLDWQQIGALRSQLQTIIRESSEVPLRKS